MPVLGRALPGGGRAPRFHPPDELETEVREAGFAVLDVVGVEGPGCLLPDPVERARLLRVAARLEREPSLLGMSDYLLAVARKP